MQIKIYDYSINTNAIFQLCQSTKKQWYFYFTIFFSCLYFGICWSASARPGFHYPYEVCSKENVGFTGRMVQESQGFSFNNTQAKTVCFNCARKRKKTTSLKITWPNNGLKITWPGKETELIMQTANKTNDIPSLCFLSSVLHTSTGAIWEPGERGYYHCSSAGAKNPVKRVKLSNCSSGHCTAQPQRPCFNEDYVQMTAKAFNETANCFGFSSREDKEKLFALMNHESSFVLNKRATSRKNKKLNTARCYGQIKHPIIIDINRYVHFGKEHVHWHKYHKIYQNFFNKCPDMAKKVTGFNGCRNQNKTSTQFVSCMAETVSERAAECQTSQNPYSCLFYTLYNVKRNEIAYQDQIEQETDRQQRILLRLKEKIKQANISSLQKKQKLRELEQMAKDFKWPIALNEILLFRGYISSKKPGGEKVYREYLFRNVQEIYELFSHVNYNPEEIAVKKTAIFNEDQLKWTFLHLAHNGGTSVIHTHFPQFIKHIKAHRINPKNRHHKAFFKKGGVIRIHRLVREFRDYATRNKKKVVNADELANFVQKINRDLKKISDPVLVKNKLNGLSVKNRLDSIQIAAFARKVRETCPGKIF